MVMQLFLLRHGETPWSLIGRHTSQTDLPLTENGEQRATRLRGLLGEMKFTQVLTSPLQRARRTCELAGLGPVARLEPELREWDYGDYEGRTTVEIHAQRPGWDIFLDGCPGGESVAQVSARADRLLARIRPQDGVVALFSHGHFLRVLAVRWIGLPLEQGRHFALETGSISILGYESHDGAMPAISLWNAGQAPGNFPR
jgi:broad specificity phosphatase PhoE